MKLINYLFVTLVAVLFFNVFSLTAFASSNADHFSTRSIEKTRMELDFEDGGGKIMTDEERAVISRGGIPSVESQEVSSWVERKGFEVVEILQVFIQPFSIIVFIFCAILMLVGAFGNGSLVSKGMVGMFISILIYIGVLYAPEILDFFLGWAGS